MLLIEHCDVEENVLFGDLFEQLGISSENEDEDFFVKNEWAIEALSLDTFYPIEGYRLTKREKQVEVTFRVLRGLIQTKFEKKLKCSPEHIVMAISEMLPDDQVAFDWFKVENLCIGSVVMGKNNLMQVVSIDEIEDDRLCDLQVSIAHSYFTNDILSHNSHFLIALAAHAMSIGKNVLYYTLELSEEDVGIRFDSNLCEMDSNECTEYDEETHDFINKQKVLDKYDEFKANLGALRIKYFSNSSASIYTFRSHMERLALKGFIPDIILIDYADIMQSTHKYEAKRYELELIYKELRELAMEKKLPIWTASQSNRSGSNAEVIDLDNMSEAYSKAFVCDVVMTISRKSIEKASGGGRLYVAKNRNGKDGILFPIHIDTAQSRFKILSDAYQPGQACAEDEDDLKARIRGKIAAMEKEKLLK